MALFYKYVAVPEVATTAAAQRNLCEQLALTGRIRLAGEGINGLLAGPEQVLSTLFAVRTHSVSHSVSHSVTQSATQSANHPLSQSANQWVRLLAILIGPLAANTAAVASLHSCTACPIGCDSPRCIYLCGALGSNRLTGVFPEACHQRSRSLLCSSVTSSATIPPHQSIPQS